MARAGARHSKRLAIAFCLIAVFFLVEAVAGFITNSLALLSDAGHMLTDVVGLGMALAAIQLASRYERSGRTGRDMGDRGAPSRHTFGLYRLEILAAFVNALLLFAVAVYVVVEAIRRLFDEPDVLGVPMLVVAAIGLAVNLVAFALLREGAADSLNVRGAYLEVLADTIGSVGVVVAAVSLELFGWGWIDPVVGAALGLWILPRAYRLGAQAFHVLLQSAPPHLDLAGLRDDLGAIPGVVGVHDLHVWTLTSEMEAASVHLVTVEGADHHSVLDQARSMLASQYRIDHGTFQIEPVSHTGCTEVEW
ncbi:MAG: cation diffusion facilitator family transporter [Ilumatobacteraceae bacterium]